MAEERVTTAAGAVPTHGASRPPGVGRAAVERVMAPTRGVLEEVGDMVLLTGRTIRSALFPPYPYGGEFVAQFLFALRLCWLPLLFSTVAINYGAAGLQAANILTLLG